MTVFNMGNKEKTENQANKDTNIKETLGKRISEYRKRKGYTQGEFAEMLSVTPQAVSKWENDISCPDITLLPAIADIFGITVDELLTGRVKITVPEKEKKHRKNIEKLRLVIRVLRPMQKPIRIALPLSVVKRFARLGVSISNAVGGDYISEEQLAEILNMVDEGISGVILDIVTEDDTNVIIEID